MKAKKKNTTKKQPTKTNTTAFTAAPKIIRCSVESRRYGFVINATIPEMQKIDDFCRSNGIGDTSSSYTLNWWATA